jgi:hypothetical protein
VGRFPHLLGGDAEARLPVLGEEGLAEAPGSVGVRPLADDEEGRVLVERDGGVEGGRRRFVDGVAGRRAEAGDAFHHPGEMRRGGAAAAADDPDAELGDEAGEVLGELVGVEAVAGGAVDDLGHAGVGDGGDGAAGVGGEVAEVLVHLGGPGRAVEADHVDAQRFDGGEGGADLGAGEHPAGELEGHLRLDGDVPAGPRHGAPASGHGGLEAEEVELGLDEEEVDASLEETEGRRRVSVPQVPVGDLAEGGEFRAGSHGAGDPAGTLRRGVPVGHLAGDAGAGERQLVGSLGDAVLGEGHGEGPEGVRLHDVDADLEEGGVEVGDDVGAGDVEDLVTPFEPLPAEVGGGEADALEVRAGGTVGDEDAAGQGVEVGAGGRRLRVGGVGGLGAVHGCSSRPSRSERRGREPTRLRQLIGQALAPCATPVAAVSQGLSLHRSG